MPGKAFIHSAQSQRTAGDLYETPYSLTELLLNEITCFEPEDTILEPAKGNGAIEKVLRKRFDSVTAYDIEKDFFTETGHYDWVFTNPPYNLADRFVEKAREVATKGVIMLLRTNFLSGVQRYRDGRFNELNSVFIFTRMPDLRFPIREDGKFHTGGIVYAWFVWLKGYDLKPVIHWLDNQDYVLKKADK